MVITEGIKSVVEGSTFLSLVTIGADGLPHPIIAGKGEVSGDTVVFGIYKMERTQKNLASNSKAWVTCATLDGGPKGYRLTGTAAASGKQVVFTAKTAEAML
ncbi:MAG: pyridoxamine 5'-phosphate oxidase family protein [Synergistaceae bacterium]|nr:pyridoxamine 5'-phosphate oxidase family protein [Synergistaceae bacterium]